MGFDSLSIPYNPSGRQTLLYLSPAAEIEVALVSSGELLAQSEGQPVTAEERTAAPPLPAGLPAPLEATGAVWRLAVEDRTLLVREDKNGAYVSAYLARLA